MKVKFSDGNTREVGVAPEGTREGETPEFLEVVNLLDQFHLEKIQVCHHLKTLSASYNAAVSSISDFRDKWELWHAHHDTDKALPLIRALNIWQSQTRDEHSLPEASDLLSELLELISQPRPLIK